MEMESRFLGRAADALTLCVVSVARLVFLYRPQAAQVGLKILNTLLQLPEYRDYIHVP